MLSRILAGQRRDAHDKGACTGPREERSGALQLTQLLCTPLQAAADVTPAWPRPQSAHHPSPSRWPCRSRWGLCTAEIRAG